MGLSLRSLALSVLLSAVPLAAQNAQSSSDLSGSAFSLTAQALQAASATVPREKATPVTVLFEEATYKFDGIGALAYTHRIIYRVEAQAGVEGWSQSSMQWDPWFENQAQIHARVLQANGVFAELDQKTINEGPVSTGDDETYSDERVRKAPLPGVAVGSIVEEVTAVSEKQPYFAGGGVYRYSFVRGVPVHAQRVTVEMPAALPFQEKISYMPALQIARDEHDGVRRVVYSQGPMPAEIDSDIDLETTDPRSAAVEFATGQSWHAIAEAYTKLADPQTIVAEGAAALPPNLPTDRMTKMQAIVEQLHKTVRYTGVEFGESRLTPQHPSEVLKRGYGDCKDKSTLLVTMLRAAGIPAHLALLRAGPGLDVNPALPGMSRFNHAIVYVPAAGSAPAVWIDATAQYYQVGALPYADRGRSALIADVGTQGLTMTPAPQPEDSVLIENRTVTLAENGPATVVERSEPHGIIEANYRFYYGGAETPKERTDLETYVKNEYIAKSLTAVEHTNGNDLQTPFTITLQVSGARRGFSSPVDAAVGILPGAIANDLPSWFFKQPVPLPPDATPEQKSDQALSEQARSATYDIAPFIVERRYRIIYPAGFSPRSLPAEKTTPIGPGSVTETFSSTEPGVVTAVLRFNSGKSRLTADEALAMRTAALELRKRDSVVLYFDQVGAKLLAAGKVKEAIQADADLIHQQPNSALQHIRMARVLLEAGIGDKAVQEARRATELDPKSAIAFSTLGWVSEHDQIGVRFGPGYDLPGALAAYRKAVSLDPDDANVRFDLAVLEEFDTHGIRYTSAADMAGAIRDYQSLIELTKERDPGNTAQYQDNLLYAFLFAHRYTELDAMLAKLPASLNHTVVGVASAVAQHGAAAGLAMANGINADTAGRNKALISAGKFLSELRLYPQAVEILNAGMQGQTDASVARQIELYRTLKPFSTEPLPPTDPRAPVHALMTSTMTDSLTEQGMSQLLTRRSFASDEEWRRNLKKSTAALGLMRSTAEKSGISALVLEDIILGTMKINATGDDATGYAMTIQVVGSGAQNMFVVMENGSYRIVAADTDTEEVGNYALYLLDHKNEPAAKHLLDWKRDLLHKAGGDDVLSGPLLPRFWTVGDSHPDAASPAAMRLAAYSLIASSKAIAPHLSEIAKMRDNLPADTTHREQRITDLNLLLTYGYSATEQGALTEVAALGLLKEEPDSLTALRLAGSGYEMQYTLAPWKALLADRLARKPADPDLLRQQSEMYAASQDFVAARASLRIVLDSGKATASDYNSYAWLGLFDNTLTPEILQAAQQSTLLSASFATLHTLASVYAAQGKTSEARQTLLQGMQAGNMAMPNDPSWYTLGMIYKDYGVMDAATAAFKRYEAPVSFVGPTDTWVLVERELKGLGNTANMSAAKTH